MGHIPTYCYFLSDQSDSLDFCFLNGTEIENYLPHSLYCTLFSKRNATWVSDPDMVLIIVEMMYNPRFTGIYSSPKRKATSETV